MAWVRPQNTKPKRKDPADAIESTRSLLLFFSGRPPPKSLTRVLHKPSPPKDYVQVKPSKHHHEPEYDEEISSRHYHEIPEHHHQEPGAHAFSFSRDRLVPIAPKHPPAPRIDRERVDHRKRMIPRTMPQYSQDPSPPPPKPRARPKSIADNRLKLPRHYVAPDASSRIVSPMWASATTPLQM